MNEKARLSIIIPHYNSPQYLRTLLASIPNIPDIQTIVVDDKSTENLEEFQNLKKAYAGKNIEFYNNDGVKSAGTCRNIGIRYAIGEWLLFADSDDYFVEHFYDTVKHSMNPDCDIVFFSPTSVIMGTTTPARRHITAVNKIQAYCENPNRENELALRYLLVGPCSKLIRKEMVLENRICFDEIIAANDIMFSTKCGYAAKKIAADTHIIYCITANEGSLTTQWREEILDARLWANLRYFTFLKEHLSDEDMKALQMDKNGRNMILQALHRGYPLRKAFKALEKYRKCGANIKPWYYLHILIDHFLLRRKDKN